MANDSELVRQMKAWGHAQKFRWGCAPLNDDAPSLRTRDHILAKNQDLAPKMVKGKSSKEKADRPLIARSGESRRATMATAANEACCKGGRIGAACEGCPSRSRVPALSMVPLWACDPIPAKNDAAHPFDHAPAVVDLGVPDDLRWIDVAMAEMARRYPLREACVREEYTGDGKNQDVKAARVAAKLKYAGKFTKWMYRREVERGLDFLEDRQSAA